MMKRSEGYVLLLFVSLLFAPPCVALRELYDRFYLTLNDSLPCFRLTNADSQIGCSASDTNTRGVVHYVPTQDSVEWLLHRSPHPPYIALMEPEVFTSYNVPRLRDSSRVNGILVRYDNDTSIPRDIPYFSAERECPNRDFGVNPPCAHDEPWNLYTNGTSLSFSDFGDFPIFAIPDHTFSKVLECFDTHNANGTGGILDYPLCSAEMIADMMAAKNTATCFRRGKLLTLLVNGLELCDPLGDKNVWGSLSNLTEEQLGNGGAIMLTAKLDSIAFFPYLSWGANNELAGVATLMAVLEKLGSLKRSGELVNTSRPILYAFFHGESWDYIGSSRMVYDMERGVFPYDEDSSKEQPPQLRMADITDYLELTNLGLPEMESGRPVTYYHNKTYSPLLERLISLSSQNNSLLLLPSSRTNELPVASLQRFLRKNGTFSGAVLSDFNSAFNNKFYGSRYDNVGNLLDGDQTLDSVAQQLADLASLITEAVAMEAGPGWSGAVPDFTASPDLIKQVLNCFLVSTNCSLFRGVLTHDKAQDLQEKPLHRYISVDTTTKSETIITYRLVANLTGHRVDGQGQPSNDPILCSNCSSLADQMDDNQQMTIVQMQFNESTDMCYCVLSHVHYHTAVSPAFHLKDYSSHEYSTWVESRWQFINLNIYLVTYPLQEVALFFCGLAMMAICLLFAVQCCRKSEQIFSPVTVAHSPLHSAAQ